MLKVNRLALLRLIEKTGEEILPCSACVKAGKPELCKVLLEKSKRYRECVQRGFAYYDVSSVPARNLDKLIREDKRLIIERELALS
jgi:hypothetical protein